MSWKRAALFSNAPWAPPRLARARVAARRAPPLSALLAGEGGRGRTPSFGGCGFFFPFPSPSPRSNDTARTGSALRSEPSAAARRRLGDPPGDREPSRATRGRAVETATFFANVVFSFSPFTPFFTSPALALETAALGSASMHLTRMSPSVPARATASMHRRATSALENFAKATPLCGTARTDSKSRAGSIFFLGIFFFSVATSDLPNAGAVAAVRVVARVLFFFFVGGVAASFVAVTRGGFVLLAQTHQQVHESVVQGLLRRVLRAHHEKARARRVVLGGGGGGSDPPVRRAGIDLREARARRVGRRRVLLRVRDADGHGDRVRGGPRGRGVVVGAHDFDRALASAQELTTRRDAPLERARGVVVRAEAYERARRR